jgi:predicted kinase
MKFIVLVGAPGLGKSTYINSSCNREDVFVYSTDDYIEMVAKKEGLTYNEIFSRKNLFREAETYMGNKLREAVAQKKNIFWDQTNMNAKKRGSILRIFKSISGSDSYGIGCVVFNAPDNAVGLTEWLRRLSSRPGKVIPNHVIENMLKSYEKPALGEGFDWIEEVNIG